MSAKLEKMKIQSSEGNFNLLINPASLSFSREIRYGSNNILGTSAEVNNYQRHGPSTLNFDFILDATGIAYKITEPIQETINKFENIVYNYIGDKHEPNQLMISWGSFTFNCRLQSLKYDYSLFKPSGEPLRVKVSVSFLNYISRSKEQKEAKQSSPNLFHSIIFKAGESLPYWSNKIYGDPSYCVVVAKYNGILNFRNIKPGTIILFPPLKRYEQIAQ